VVPVAEYTKPYFGLEYAGQNYGRRPAMPKRAALLLFVFGSVALTGHSSADEASDIVKATTATMASSRELRATRSNLFQMRASLTADEKEAVDGILDSEDSFDGYRSETETVGVIFEHIDCKSDREFVRVLPGRMLDVTGLYA